MSLATTAALGSIVLFVISALQRRFGDAQPWLTPARNLMIVAVLAVVAVYFYLKVIA